MHHRLTYSLYMEKGKEKQNFKKYMLNSQNVQLGIMDGYIMNIIINTDANDMNSFQSTIEKYKEMYGEYPKGVCADAGYGSKKNYKYCDRNKITAYIKYPNYEKEQKKWTEKKI